VVESSYRISCHCGEIRLKIAAGLGQIFECNCSICSRSAFLHWYVAPEQVKLLTQKRQLATYVWRSATGGHRFCPTCGIAVIRTSTQYPPPVSVNARCIEDFDLARLKTRQFDGRHAFP
jgi:hypothetical protein